MPRLKTKSIPFSNTAEEVKPGVYRFTVGGREWEFASGAGFNFGPVDDQGKSRYQLFMKTLTEAACYAEGFYAGRNQG